MSITEIWIKVLRKLGLFHMFNFKTTVYIRDKKMLVPMIKGMGIENIYLKASWLGQIIEELKLDEKALFIDVGVNIGQTLIQLKSVNNKVRYLGFEPGVNCSYYTNELIKINQFKNCTLLNLALSDRQALIELEFDSETDARASINAELRPGYFKNKSQILAVNFDENFKELPVSFIKIDVEGAEFSVLKGLKNQLMSSQPIIVCEVLDSHNKDVLVYTQDQANALFNFLKELDYLVIQLIQSESYDKLIDFKEITQFEIKLWEKKSSRYNDYIFVPRNKKETIISILEKINR